MPIHYLILAVLVAAGLIAALVSHRPRVAIPTAFATAALGAVLSGMIAAERLYIPAVIVLAGTIGVILVGVDHLRHPTGQARRAPGPCPSWCEIDHLTPLSRQAIVYHERLVDAAELNDGGEIEVRIVQLEHLTGAPADGPVAVFGVYGQDAIEMELTGDEAAVLATALAADRSRHRRYAFNYALAADAGWMAHALAEAARFLGYQPALDGAA